MLRPGRDLPCLQKSSCSRKKTHLYSRSAKINTKCIIFHFVSPLILCRLPEKSLPVFYVFDYSIFSRGRKSETAQNSLLFLPFCLPPGSESGKKGKTDASFFTSGLTADRSREPRYLCFSPVLHLLYQQPVLLVAAVCCMHRNRPGDEKRTIKCHLYESGSYLYNNTIISERKKLYEFKVIVFSFLQGFGRFSGFS